MNTPDNIEKQNSQQSYFTLHSTCRNVAHRDIKSNNILLGGAFGKDIIGAPPIVKMADFGTSVRIGVQESPASDLRGKHIICVIVISSQ